jgi:general stress protein 26
MIDNAARETIWKHVQAIGTCMMVSREDRGMRARPMRGMPRPEQNAIWFFAETDNNWDEELLSHPGACLTYVDVRDNIFVSLSGRLSRVLDQATINEMWDDHAGSYFADGPDDPRVMLLHFQPETGEYWEAPSSPIVIAIKFLQAKIMGERPSLGTKGRTELP